VGAAAATAATVAAARGGAAAAIAATVAAARVGHSSGDCSNSGGGKGGARQPQLQQQWRRRRGAQQRQVQQQALSTPESSGDRPWLAGFRMGFATGSRLVSAVCAATCFVGQWLQQGLSTNSTVTDTIRGLGLFITVPGLGQGMWGYVGYLVIVGSSGGTSLPAFSMPGCAPCWGLVVWCAQGGAVSLLCQRQLVVCLCGVSCVRHNLHGPLVATFSRGWAH
jgi:hypothetical protein